MEINKMKVSKSRQKILILLSILILGILGVFLYKMPQPFEKIVSLEEQHKTNNMYAWGNIPNGNDNMEISNDKIQKVFKTFASYKYTRCIDGPTGGIGVFVHLVTDSPRWTIIIEVWANGYIRIPNNEVYKILSEDKTELFDKITKLLE